MDAKKILLVDDEAAIRKMVKAVLNDARYSFTEASNGLEAQVFLEREHYDLIISDVIMPDCDGIELVMTIRRRFPDVKVVMMSGGGRVRAGHYLDLAGKLGAAKVFEKPFDTAELREAVKGLLFNEPIVECE
ncbi:MAG: response regulator [Kiritimatiellales bacterium]|jgi:CheY-like chemotaxis protein